MTTIVKLGEVCEKAVSGGTPNTKHAEYYGGGIPWLRTQEVNFCNIYETEQTITQEGLDNSSAKYIPENSVIIAMYGATAGKVAVNKIPLTTNQACCNLIVDKEKADYRYIYYSLYGKCDWLLSQATGAAQQNLNIGQIKNFDLTLPPLPEQRRVAGILGSLDEKIENNRRLIRTLETLARTLFKKHITKNPERENWETSKVSETCDIISGGTPKTSVAEYWNGDIPWLSVADFGGGRHWVLDAEKHITQAGVDNSATNILEEGDIILSARGTVGEIAQLGKPMAFNQSCFGLRVRKHITQDYLWCFLKESVDELKRGSHGSTFDTINRSIFDRLSIKLPPVAVLQAFKSAVAPLFSKTAFLTRENQTLAALRDKLLRKLIK